MTGIVIKSDGGRTVTEFGECSRDPKSPDIITCKVTTTYYFPHPHLVMIDIPEKWPWSEQAVKP